MKRSLPLLGLAGLVWLGLSCDVHAASKSKPSAFSTAGISKSVAGIGTGTKKFVQGTVDVLTLKPLWQKKTKLPPPSKPWLNNTRKKKAEPKKSLWSSLFPSKEKPKRVETMKDFVGLDRPK